MSDHELTDNEGPPEINPIPKYILTSNSIPATNPSENEAMIYNLSQAAIHKFNAALSGKCEPSSDLDRAADWLRSSRSNCFDSIEAKAESRDVKVSELDDKHGCTVDKFFLDPNTNRSDWSIEETSFARSRKQSVNYTSKMSFIPSLSSTKHFHQKLQSDESKPSENLKVFYSRLQSTENLGFSPKLNNQTRNVSKPAKPPRHLQATDQENSNLSEKKFSRIPCRQSPLRYVQKRTSRVSILKPEESFQVKRSDKNEKKLQKSDNQFPWYRNKEAAKNTSEHNGIVKQLITLPEETHEVNLTKDSSAVRTKNEIPLFQERPDPVGCSFEPTTLHANASNSFLGRQNQNTGLIKKVNTNEDSEGRALHNNKDGLFLEESAHENKEVDDINFFCLAFATRNPLVPLSKRDFRQQITNNLQQKLSVESSDQNLYHNLNAFKENLSDLKILGNGSSKLDQNAITPLRQKSNFVDQKYHEKENSSSLANDTVCSKKFFSLLDSKENEAERATKSEYYVIEQTSEDDEEQHEISEIKKMPKLNCSYTLNTPSNKFKKELFHSSAKSNLASAKNSNCDSFAQEVCLYDTDSLAMSYVNTKQKSCSSQSVSLLSSNSTFGKRNESTRTNNAYKTSCRPVIMTKSTSKEGTTLTLVKKEKSTGSTLELLITNEIEENQQLSTIEKAKDKNFKKLPHQADSSSSIKSKKVLQTLSQLSPKRANWSGITCLAHKKNPKWNKSYNKQSKLQKPKANLFKKVLSTKTKTSDLGTKLESSIKKKTNLYVTEKPNSTGKESTNSCNSVLNNSK